MAEVLQKLSIDASWPIFSRLLLCILIVGLCVAIWMIRQPRKANAHVRKTTTCSDNKKSPITPLEGFNWEKTEPLQFRPFKGKDKYNLTMGESPWSALIQMCNIIYKGRHMYKLIYIST
jgi:hypothetical protein